MSSDFYQVQFGAIPRPVNVNVEVEARSPVATRRDIENAAFEIAFHEIQARGGPAGFSTVKYLMPLRRRHPDNALSHPNFPGVHVWLA
jgi:hypothetical protein